MAEAGAVEERMRFAVVDGDKDTRHRFRDILQSQRKFCFAGGFSSAGEALSGMPRLQSDFSLVDMDLPDMDGIECTRQLRLLLPHLKIVIVSRNHETSLVDRSLEAGASAYLIKPLEPAQLLATLPFVTVRTNGFVGFPSGKSKKAAHLTLSQRERDVLGKLAEGLLYKEIADTLGISYTAVRKSQHRIFRKLHVSNRTEAARLWLEHKDVYCTNCSAKYVFAE